MPSAKFESGGVFGSTSPIVQNRISTGVSPRMAMPVQIDYDRLGTVLASKINNVKIVTPVDTITDIQIMVASVEEGANV
nr:hypothetical protein [uncultured Allomuricauda sp.]